MNRLASEAAPLGSRAESRAVGFDQVRHESFYAAAGQNSGFRFILSGDSQQRAEARNSDDTVAEMQRSDGTTTQSYLYTYLSSPDPNAGKISNLTLRQKVGNGAWTIVRQDAYDYYDGTSNKPFGNLGDLRSSRTLDGNNNVIDVTYYRYYTPADAGTIGYVHGLKYVFSPQSYARMAADINSPFTATDAQVAPYADAYYQYNPTSQQVTEAVIQGSGCSVCTGGQGTYTYGYQNSNLGNGYNTWATATYETLPDGTTNTVYANYVGETMLDVFQSGGQQWLNYYQYDSSGRLILQANPSAVSGYNPCPPSRNPCHFGRLIL